MALEELGRFPEVAGKYSGTAIVCGSGHTLWDDLEVSPVGDIIAVNFAALLLPLPVKHVYSDHSDILYPFRLIKSALSRQQDLIETLYHSSSEGPRVDHVWPWPRHGTSSLGAAYTAIALGYDEVHICGVPLDNGPHFYDPPWMVTNFAKQCPEGMGGGPRYWESAKRQYFQGKVIAHSGRLKEILA